MRGLAAVKRVGVLEADSRDGKAQCERLDGFLDRQRIDVVLPKNIPDEKLAVRVQQAGRLWLMESQALGLQRDVAAVRHVDVPMMPARAIFHRGQVETHNGPGLPAGSDDYPYGSNASDDPADAAEEIDEVSWEPVWHRPSVYGSP